jgi:hypothetical protein
MTVDMPRDTWVLAVDREQAEAIMSLVRSGMPSVYMAGALSLCYDVESGARTALAAAQGWMLAGKDRLYAQGMTVHHMTGEVG